MSPVRCIERSIEGHRIAQVMLAISYAPAIEADILGVFCHCFDLIKTLKTGQYAQVALVVALTDFFSHKILLSPSENIV